MSQCYQVKLKESISRVIQHSDTVTYPLELTELLPKERMLEILKEVLLQEGWIESEQNKNTLTKKGTVGEDITLDLESMIVSATLEEEREVSTEIEVTQDGYDRKVAQQQARDALNQKVGSVGDQIEEQGNRDLKNELIEALESSDADRQRDLNQILQQVYGIALKEKAGQMGEILEVQESQSDDNYELTIRIAH